MTKFKRAISAILTISMLLAFLVPTTFAESGEGADKYEFIMAEGNILIEGNELKAPTPSESRQQSIPIKLKKNDVEVNNFDLTTKDTNVKSSDPNIVDVTRDGDNTNSFRIIPKATGDATVTYRQHLISMWLCIYEKHHRKRQCLLPV